LIEKPCYSVELIGMTTRMYHQQELQNANKEAVRLFVQHV